MSQKRIPVLISEEAHESLRKLSFDTRLSIAEHIRQAINVYINININKDFDSQPPITPKRIPVLISEEAHESLRKLSFESRLSIAEHIRRAVDGYLNV